MTKHTEIEYHFAHEGGAKAFGYTVYLQEIS
jgi:hypothetical protein